MFGLVGIVKTWDLYTQSFWNDDVGDDFLDYGEKDHFEERIDS